MNEAYDITATMHEYLNLISMIILFLVIGGIGIHIFFRIRRSRTLNKEE